MFNVLYAVKITKTPPNMKESFAKIQCNFADIHDSFYLYFQKPLESGISIILQGVCLTGSQ